MNILHSRSPELKQLFEALGIDPSQTKRIVITIEPDSIVTVNVENFLRDFQGKRVFELINSYALMELKQHGN